MDEMSLKKMVLLFEKRVYKNQEMRIKFSDQPEKYANNTNMSHLILRIPQYSMLFFSMF